MTIKETSTTTEFIEAGNIILKLNRGSVFEIIAESKVPIKVVVLSVVYSQDQKNRVDYLNAMTTTVKNGKDDFEPYTITRKTLINPDTIKHLENDKLRELYRV